MQNKCQVIIAERVLAAGVARKCFKEKVALELSLKGRLKILKSRGEERVHSKHEAQPAQWPVNERWSLVSKRQ